MFRRIGIRAVLLIGDLSVIVLSLYFASWLRPQLDFGKPIPSEAVWLLGMVYILAMFVWGVGFYITDVYNLQKTLRFVDEFQRLVAAHIASTLAFAGLLYFSFRDISRLQIMVFALISMVLLLIYRGLFRLALYSWGEKRYGSRRVLIVGANDVGRSAAQVIEKNKWTGLCLVGFVDDASFADTLNYPRLGALDQTTHIIKTQKINEVIFALPRQDHVKLANLAVSLQALNVNVRAVPDFFDLVFLRAVVEDLGDMPLVTLKEPALDPLQRLVKRSFDLFFGAIGIILTLPIMVIIAVGIKRDSPGPIIFTQQRVGENGRTFNMYKFRTMYYDPMPRYVEKIVNGESIHKFYDDPRVTPFGRFLRSTSLDELPQLFNIIKGEMSLVGPRPELPILVDRYKNWQHKRFEVPQGLTGWWQVNGRADKPMHLNTQDDLYYIKNYSIWLDIQILWRTISTVLSRRGSY